MKIKESRQETTECNIIIIVLVVYDTYIKEAVVNVAISQILFIVLGVIVALTMILGYLLEPISRMING